MSCNNKDNKKALKEAQNKLFTQLKEHHRLNSICQTNFLLGNDYTFNQQEFEAFQASLYLTQQQINAIQAQMTGSFLFGESEYELEV
jgi:hypothetical protein